MSPGQELRDQPIPRMFGFGKHMCPGKELAKLEIVLFLKYFLSKYKYRMVGRQVRLGAAMLYLTDTVMSHAEVF